MKPKTTNESPADGARHCLSEVPYRMVVFQQLNHHGKPLYLVAGMDAPAAGAEKALRRAHELHGGHCFYCKKPLGPGEITIDHVEPVRRGGRDELQNLLIACDPCNSDKGPRAIESFRPDAGREWLSALLLQVQDRLGRL